MIHVDMPAGKGQVAGVAANERHSVASLLPDRAQPARQHLIGHVDDDDAAPTAREAVTCAPRAAGKSRI
jgi:hypothetical protein